MNINIKLIAPYLVIAASIIMTWGMWTERLQAVENKADKIEQMQQDIAVIKEKILWIENYLINK
tara:strand:- start:153 stop:344 length:192 start_codon:yes stop_codon:yes gene_type:complete